MASGSDVSFVASRVQQLDAQVLDNELESLFTQQLKRCLSFLSVEIPSASTIQPELEALIKLYIFRHSIYSNGSSLGQQMLDLALVDSCTKAPLSTSQKVGLAASLIILPYLLKRFGRLLLPPKTHANLEFFYKSLNILNFVVFLTNGRFKSVIHRVLGITCGYRNPSSVFNPINYDYMSREVLWFSFAELLSFVLPLVNIVKIENFLKRIIHGESGKISKPQRLNLPSPGTRSPSDFSSCAVCNEPPVNTREIGCTHCFCYYCVMVKMLADPDSGFSCPQCDFHIQDVAQIREVYLKGF